MSCFSGDKVLEAVLQVTTAADDLGVLAAGEETAPLEVVERICHPLQPVRDDVHRLRRSPIPLVTSKT